MSYGLRPTAYGLWSTAHSIRPPARACSVYHGPVAGEHKSITVVVVVVIVVAAAAAAAVIVLVAACCCLLFLLFLLIMQQDQDLRIYPSTDVHNCRSKIFADIHRYAYTSISELR